MHAIRDQLRPAIVSLALLTLLCGFVYPMAITAVAEVAMPHPARGSLIEREGAIVGSELIGQPFDAPEYLWGRPSATAPVPYVAFSRETLSGSSGSNLGPTNPAFLDAVRERIAHLRGTLGADVAIPAELVTASGSGLDPHISPAAALCQVGRIAAARGVAEAEVRRVIERHVEGRTLGFLGEPRVNVLRVNLDLDEALARSARPLHSVRSSP